MNRRDFITLLGGAATWPLAARAQQSDRVRLIGVMGGGVANDPNAQANIAAFLQVLEKLGWTVGRNLRIESRQGAGNVDDTRMTVKALPGSALEVIETKFFFQLLVSLLANPSRLDGGR
jgi:putative tryptophan/tyrosine transport system substrate-binding protein